MKLYVMRHGPAEDHAEGGDADRALTAAGRKRVTHVAEALAKEGEKPLHIVASPLVRALQTAEIVAAVVQLDDQGNTVSVRRELAPGGDAPGLVHRMAASGNRRVMLVGHEPDLSELVSTLLRSGAPASDFDRGFEKAMVVGLHLAADGPVRLRFVLDPRSLCFDRALSS